MKRLPAKPVVAIVGSTGAVGEEMLRVMEQRDFPIGELRLLASERSAGKTQTFRGNALTIRESAPDAFDGVDLAMFCASGSLARELGPEAVKRGAMVVDNSSAFRMEPAVPLIVPEVNGAELDGLTEPSIIANPNCSTIIMMVALHALEEAFGIERIVVSTYQAVSGAGAPGLEELERLKRASAAGEPLAPEFFPFPCVDNVFVHETEVDPGSGRNVEEQKMVEEARKIWGRPDLGLAPTCVRVPVPRAHSESLNVTLRTPVSEREVRERLASAKGVRVMDDRGGRRFPMPIDASHGDDVLVGHIRPDDSQSRDGTGQNARFRGWSLFACGDQLRKGAALNAVQIAELLLP